MDHRIAFLTADATLSETVSNLFPKEIASGQFKIYKIDVDKSSPKNTPEGAVRSLAQQIEREGYEAAITRGGVFFKLTEMLKIPVFSIDVNTVDVLQSIRITASHQKQILLLLWNNVFFEEQSWKDVLKIPVIVERFRDTTDIETILTRYQHRKEEYVVLSGGIGASIAQRFGFDCSIFICSPESIYDTVCHVNALLTKYQEEQYKKELLERVISNSHDAIIAVDNDSHIILLNSLAENLLSVTSNSVLGKKLADCLPNLTFILDHFADDQTERTEVRQINEKSIAANVSILQDNGVRLGTVCLFQDITRVQKLEKKIRYEMNKKGLVARYTLDHIITQDPGMKQVIANAKIAANSDHTITLLGESGTGKELMAQGIHNASHRSTFPFVAVNCAALSESLLESELFGYEEGAFTGARKGGKQGLFELAHGGTIFLDEINSISLSLQTKLLRVLEEKEIMHIGSDYVIPLDVRIIVAANESLNEMVNTGHFRRDLFYRLNTLELFIPPLRERGNDILLLFDFYLKREGASPELLSLSKEYEKKLTSYTWPGNVRELRNVVQRYLLFGTLDLDPNELYTQSENSNSNLLNLKEINQFVEEKVIHMLLKSGKTKMQIADILGISRSALWKKLNHESQPDQDSDPR